MVHYWWVLVHSGCNLYAGIISIPCQWWMMGYFSPRNNKLLKEMGLAGPIWIFQISM
jgi:hypothetical protein